MSVATAIARGYETRTPIAPAAVSAGYAHRFNEFGILATPDGAEKYDSKKAKASIDFACIGNEWIAEYQFRFLCGRFHGSTLPLSTYSTAFPTKAEALRNAAARLVADIQAKCGNAADLPKVEQQELAEMLAWAESLVAKPQEESKPFAGMTFMDGFAGIGGIHLGLTQQGARCVAAVEIDAAARETYLENHSGDYRMYRDIRDVDTDDLPDFDILAGGFPCQSFSTAGSQHGYNDPDKGALFFELIRIAKARQPKLMILENVEGFATHDGGKTADRAMTELANIGYSPSFEVLNASEFGVPQQRKRVFIVAVRLDIYYQTGNPFSFPQGEKPSRVVADILESGITDWRCSKPMVPKPTAKPDPTRPIQVGLINGNPYQGSRVMSPDGQGITLCALSGGFGQTGLYMVDGKPRGLTVRECARMQGFPENFRPHPNNKEARKQFGNSVAVPVVAAVAAAAGRFIQGELRLAA